MRIRDILSALFSGNLFSNRELADVRDEVSFQDAIAAHLAWKQRLIDEAAGRPPVTALRQDIGTDTQCVLGLWIHGAGRRRYGNFASFVELREQHARFHKVALRIAELSRAQQSADAERLMKGEFQKLSADIVARLTHLSDLFGS